MLAKAKIAKGGKISIPSICRKYLNIKTGDEIVFSLHDNQLVISPIQATLEKARKLVNKYHDPNKSLVEELITERRLEAENE